MADKKIVTVFMNNGSEIACLTQMPESEIVAEIEGTGEKANDEWVRLECLYEDSSRVPVAFLRHMIAAYLIKPAVQSRIAVPPAPQIVRH